MGLADAPVRTRGTRRSDRDIAIAVLSDLTGKGKDVSTLVEPHDFFEWLLSHQHDEMFEMELLNQRFHSGLQGTESDDAAVKPVATDVQQMAGVDERE